MAKYRLLIDHHLCFGCYACEVACQQENDLPVGLKWISVKTVGPKLVNGKLVMEFVPMTCRHCNHAPCITACPEDAIYKSNEGIVLISSERCIGCLACLEACPFSAIQFDEHEEIAQKCNLCHHRLETGLKPACVQTCPAGAIQHGDINEITEQHRQRRANLIADGF